MSSRIKQLIAGNWKMNGTSEDIPQIALIVDALKENGSLECDALLCVPNTLITRAVDCAQGALHIGAENCHKNISGAHTGDVSAEMVKDAGATHIIVGHSERRKDHHETNSDVRAKAEACHRAGVTAIICVGETQEQRDSQNALNIVKTQLAQSIPEHATANNTVIAYEPVWAIGTGLTATAQDIKQMHGHIRTLLTERFREQGQAMRILYGGSMKPSNASEILSVENVNGGLIGGASLKAKDFTSIVSASQAMG